MTPRRETGLFPDPTSLRYDVRSGYYTGQRDYAVRLRCVPSVRQTARTHSADHLCLIPRRKATCGTGQRTPSPLRVPVLALRVAARSQRTWLALSRLRHRQVTLSPGRPGTSQWATRRCWHERPADTTLLAALRGWVSALLPVNSDNTHCAFVPSCLSHYFILIAPTLLTREPLQRGIKLRTMWRCLHRRCFTVTLTADPHLASVRAVRAPACRHPSRQHRRSAVLKMCRGIVRK